MFNVIPVPTPAGKLISTVSSAVITVLFLTIFLGYLMVLLQPLIISLILNVILILKSLPFLILCWLKKCENISSTLKPPPNGLPFPKGLPPPKGLSPILLSYLNFLSLSDKIS